MCACALRRLCLRLCLCARAAGQCTVETVHLHIHCCICAVAPLYISVWTDVCVYARACVCVCVRARVCVLAQACAMVAQACAMVCARTFGSDTGVRGRWSCTWRCRRKCACVRACTGVCVQACVPACRRVHCRAVRGGMGLTLPIFSLFLLNQFLREEERREGRRPPHRAAPQPCLLSFRSCSVDAWRKEARAGKCQAGPETALAEREPG